VYRNVNSVYYARVRGCLCQDRAVLPARDRPGANVAVARKRQWARPELAPRPDRPPRSARRRRSARARRVLPPRSAPAGPVLPELAAPPASKHAEPSPRRRPAVRNVRLGRARWPRAVRAPGVHQPASPRPRDAASWRPRLQNDPWTATPPTSRLSSPTRSSARWLEIIGLNNRLCEIIGLVHLSISY